MPGVVVGGVNDGRATWSRVRFPNGDQVMISMARDEAKLFKMKWGGLIPGGTLATLDAIALVDTFDLWGAEYTPLTRSQAILARVTELVMARNSADEVAAAFNDPSSELP